MRIYVLLLFQGVAVMLLQFGTILLLACTSLFGQQYIISTIIGEGATGALLHNPTSVAVDSEDNVYLADWSGIIRKISTRDGAVTVVAGIGILGYSGDGGPAISAMLGKGISFALDGAGDIYIADYENNRIRRVDATTGIITTVAGTGAATDSGDGGPAVNAGVRWPTGVAVDPAGDLYFSSSGSRVRKLISSTGIIEPGHERNVESRASGGIGFRWESLHSRYDQSPDTAGGRGNGHHLHNCRKRSRGIQRRRRACAGCGNRLSGGHCGRLIRESLFFR
jgi:hypothetical protein